MYLQTFAVVIFFSTLGLFSIGCASPVGKLQVKATSSGSSFSIYFLSRGRGVPENARKALQEIRTILEEAKGKGTVVMLKQTRIGLEGETRLCAEFSDEETALEMREYLSRLINDVELVNLVVEPCPK